MLYNASYYYRIIHMYGTNLPVATSDLKCLGSQADLEVPNTSSIPFGKAFLRPYFLWGHRSGTLRFFINQMLINKSHTPFNSKTYTFSIHIYIYKGHHYPPTRKNNNYIIQVPDLGENPPTALSMFRGFP